MPFFVIKRTHKQSIIDHALANKPIEVCGVIAGVRWNGSEFDRLIRMDNVAEEWGTSFEFDPGQQISVWNDIESRGEIVAAIYHSHTRNIAYPSRRDIAGAQAVDPMTHHIIVSVHDDPPSFRAFKISGEVVHEVSIQEI